MEFRRVKKDDVLVYYVKGYLTDDSNAYDFIRDMRKMINEEEGKFVVDLSGVDLMISSGIGILATIVTSAKRAEPDLRFAAIPHKVQQTMTIVGLMHAIEAYPSIDEAIAAFSEE